MDSDVCVPTREPNRQTEPSAGVVPHAADLRTAYAFARAIASVHPDPPVPGHRLVWLRGTAYASTLLPADGDAFAVLGRHTRCSVPLADDPTVALRHLLVRSVALPSGGAALGAIDLHTGTGVRLADGTRETAMLAEGPVAFAVGDYAVVALPTAGDVELPAELPSLEHAPGDDERAQLAALARVMAPEHTRARRGTSHVVRLPSPIRLGEPLAPSLGRLVGGRYRLTLSRDDLEATVVVTDDDLVRGVVIGRSEKCHSEALRRVTESGTSRVHVLLLREGGAIHAYDLASTQGTYVGAARVSRARLPEQGTAMLILGNTPSAVRLAWRAG